MKALYGFLILLLFSCQQKDEKKLIIHEKHATEKQEQKEPTRKKSKSIGETTHILYIDIAKEKTYANKTIHSIKAKVLIKDDRSVEVVQFQDPPSTEIIEKINKLLETYRVRQESLDKGKIKTGECIVRLRFAKD